MQQRKLGVFSKPDNSTVPTVMPRWFDLATEFKLTVHRRFQDDRNGNRILDIHRHDNGQVSMEFTFACNQNVEPLKCNPTFDTKKMYAFIDKINNMTDNSLSPIEHILTAFIENEHEKYLKCSDIKSTDLINNN